MLTTTAQQAQARSEDSIDCFLPRVIPIECSLKTDPFIYSGRADYLYFVVSGCVRLHREVGVPDAQLKFSSRQVHIGFYGPGDIFGEDALVPGLHSGEWAAPFPSCVLMRYTAPGFTYVPADRRIGLYRKLMEISIARSQAFAQRMADAMRLDLAHRLAADLLRTAAQIGTEKRPGEILVPFLPHRLWAEIVGTSREIVTHHFVKFQRYGLVMRPKRRKDGMLVYPKKVNDFLTSG